MCTSYGSHHVAYILNMASLISATMKISYLIIPGGVCALAIIYAIYLLRFHPYARYPGPLLARLTPFHALWHAHKGDLHLDVLRCHNQYGILPDLHIVESHANMYQAT